MKSLYLRSGLALLVAVILTACGGNNGSLALSGSIVGLAKSGLVLVNKSTGEKLTIDVSSTTFVFNKLLAVDEQFDVEVDTQPIGAVCTASSNTGKGNVYNVYSVVVSCVTNPYVLGGTAHGLKSVGLILSNGADTVAVLPSVSAPGSDVSFVFPTKVADGSPFGVTLLAQPAGQTCTVDTSNNVGTMPAGDALGLNVTCK